MGEGEGEGFSSGVAQGPDVSEADPARDPPALMKSRSRTSIRRVIFVRAFSHAALKVRRSIHSYEESGQIIIFYERGARAHTTRTARNDDVLAARCFSGMPRNGCGALQRRR